MRIELLGGLRVETAERAGRRAISRFATQKVAALLAFLAFYRHQSHPREILYEMLWPGCEPKDGRSRLSNALWSLRRQLEPPGTPAGSVLQCDRFAVGLNPALVTTDVAEFLAALKAADRARDHAERVGLLQRVADLYRGELLPGFYEDWVLTEQRRLAEIYARAEDELADLTDRPPVPERLPVEDEGAGKALPPDREPRPVRSAPLPPTQPVSLPPVFTRFFGREEEITRLSGMLAAPDTRLVTLSGAGGTGKTRLAVEVARCAAGAFPGGVWFVSLADLRYARLIGGALADALGLARQSKQEPIELVIAFLQGHEGRAATPALVILDNYEHLVEEGAALVRALLGRAPAVTCLVTSRRLLGLSAEREFPLAPLPTPVAGDTPERLSHLASIRLFVDRAQAVRPDFQVTARNAGALAELVCRLEGIPLAIELAAARASVLTPAQMLSLLSSHRFDALVTKRRDAPEHHRSLWAALDRSYRLLAPELQRFFRRLSIFRGGWTVEAAEAVCEEPQALDYLEELRTCSLVLTEESKDGMRFRVLETLREYGQEQLSAAEFARVRTRHVEFFFARAARLCAAEDTMQAPWLERLESDHDNFRAVLETCLASETGGETALHLCNALQRFWIMRGHYSEGRRFFSAALSHPTAPGRAPARAAALNSASTLAHDQGDFEAATALAREGLAISQELGLTFSVGWSLACLGDVLLDQGDCGAARAFYEQTLAIYREAGHRWFVAISLQRLGRVAMYQGDYATARALYKESLETAREEGDSWGVGTVLLESGFVAARQGDYATAGAFYKESLETARDFGLKRESALLLEGCAEAALSRRQTKRSARLYGAADALRRALGAPLPSFFQPEHAANMARLRGALGEGAFAAAWFAGQSLTWEEAVAYALEGT